LIGKNIIECCTYGKTQNSTTIVTAFFSFVKSKHNRSEYKQWLENLLSYTENPMMIFTSKELAPLVKGLRDARSLIVCEPDQNCFPTVIITDFDTPWDIPPIKHIKDVLMSQVDIDPEKEIHSPDSYAIWNAKAWMLEYVALKNPFNTRYFLWVDGGAFRSAQYRFGPWPNHKKIVEIFEKNESQKLLLGLINQLPQEMCVKSRIGSMRYNATLGPMPRDLIEGTMFGGSSESVHWWSQSYYETISLYIRKKWFVGKDQNTMNSLAFAHPEKIHVILAFKLQCGDIWFAFGPLFTDQQIASNAFGDICQPKNLSSIVVPLTDVCLDKTNLITH
jgi:hypothetical protein